MGSNDPETHAEWVGEVIFFWDGISKINGIVWGYMHRDHQLDGRSEVDLNLVLLGTRFYEDHLTIPL